MNTEFLTWLERELDKRAWNHSDLARQAGRSHGAISHLFIGLSSPTIELCNAIADALGYSRNLVIERAGLIQTDQMNDDITDNLASIARLLPEAERVDLLDTARAKLRRYGKQHQPA